MPLEPLKTVDDILEKYNRRLKKPTVFYEPPPITNQKAEPRTFVDFSEVVAPLAKNNSFYYEPSVQHVVDDHMDTVRKAYKILYRSKKHV